MKWLLALALLVRLSATAQTNPALADAAPKPDLESASSRSNGLAFVRAKFQDIINQPQYATAFWGVKVASLANGRVLFEHNAGKLFSPASNCKLYTVALGLDKLGPDYRIKTSIYTKANPTGEGVLEGDLVVFGRGDPTLKPFRPTDDVLTALQPLVHIVTNAGIRSIHGNLVADASFLRGPEFGSGWSWDDQQYYYGAELSALTINDNILLATVTPAATEGGPCEVRLKPALSFFTVVNRTTTGPTNGNRSISLYRAPSSNILYVSGRLPVGGKPFMDDVPIHVPARAFGELFAQALGRAGVDVEGQVITKAWPSNDAALPDGYVELGAAQSPPLSEIAAKIQKPSQNLYTDLLLAQVGEHSRAGSTPADKTSEELGIAEVTKFLEKAGIPRRQFFLEEGSGLSRDNLVTPEATVQLLRHMSRHPAADVFRNSLPIAGVDGTLRNRLKDTPAMGNVRAKTGSLRWASSLSGYVTSAAGEKLVFSFMVNRFHPAEPAKSARTDLDAMALLLANLSEAVSGDK